MSSMFIVARHDARRVVVTPVLTPYLGQPLLTRRCQITCLPNFTAPESSRRRRVASHLRETESQYIETVLLRALRHDSPKC